MVSFTAAAIGIGTSVVGGVATKAITGAMGSGSGGGDTSSAAGGSGGAGGIQTYNGSGVTPATTIAGAIQQNDIAINTANNQTGDILTGQTQANSILAPYNTAGTAADQQLADLEGLNGADAATAAMAKFTASPGYAYQVEQGLRAVDHGAAARGMSRSGDTLKAEQTLGNNLANQDFAGYVTRLNSLLTPGLAAGAGIAATDTGAAAAQSKIAGQLGVNQANAAGASMGAVGSLVNSGINALTKLGSGLSGGGYSGADKSTPWDTTGGTGGTTSAANNAVLNNLTGPMDTGIGTTPASGYSFGAQYNW